MSRSGSGRTAPGSGPTSGDRRLGERWARRSRAGLPDPSGRSAHAWRQRSFARPVSRNRATAKPDNPEPRSGAEAVTGTASPVTDAELIRECPSNRNTTPSIGSGSPTRWSAKPSLIDTAPISSDCTRIEKGEGANASKSYVLGNTAPLTTMSAAFTTRREASKVKLPDIVSFPPAKVTEASGENV